jgi:hypothetical protein
MRAHVRADHDDATAVVNVLERRPGHSQGPAGADVNDPIISSSVVSSNVFGTTPFGFGERVRELPMSRVQSG